MQTPVCCLVPCPSAPGLVDLDPCIALSCPFFPPYHQVVVDYDAVPLLVQLLMHANADIREQCAWCLGNIAGDSSALRDVVLQVRDTAPLSYAAKPALTHPPCPLTSFRVCAPTTNPVPPAARRDRVHRPQHREPRVPVAAAQLHVDDEQPVPRQARRAALVGTHHGSWPHMTVPFLTSLTVSFLPWACRWPRRCRSSQASSRRTPTPRP